MGVHWRDHLAGWPLPPAPFQLAPEKTALIVVDVQRHAADPDVGDCMLLKDKYPEMAEYYISRLQQTTIPAIQRLIGYFREHDLQRLFLCVGPWYEDRRDLTPRQRRREVVVGNKTGHQILFHHGHPVHEFIPEVAPQEGELLIHKNSTSAFTTTGIDLMLRNMGMEYLIFCGLATQACVETTARDASDRGYYCVLLDDACITFSQAAHDATLLNFSATFGRVDDTDSVIQELERASVPEAEPATVSDD